MFCRRCWLDFKTNEHFIQCSGPCGWYFHNRCVDLPDAVAHEMLANQELEWYCFHCRQLYRLQLYFEVCGKLLKATKL